MYGVRGGGQRRVSTEDVSRGGGGKLVAAPNGALDKEDGN